MRSNSLNYTLNPNCSWGLNVQFSFIGFSLSRSNFTCFALGLFQPDRRLCCLFSNRSWPGRSGNKHTQWSGTRYSCIIDTCNHKLSEIQMLDGSLFQAQYWVPFSGLPKFKDFVVVVVICPNFCYPHIKSAVGNLLKMWGIWIYYEK